MNTVSENPKHPCTIADVMPRLFCKVFIENDGVSTIKFTNHKKKGKSLLFRNKPCWWTLHVEFYSLKLFVCRFLNGA